MKHLSFLALVAGALLMPLHSAQAQDAPLDEGGLDDLEGGADDEFGDEPEGPVDPGPAPDAEGGVGGGLDLQAGVEAGAEGVEAGAEGEVTYGDEGVVEGEDAFGDDAGGGDELVDDDVEEITVTGSRVKRTIFSAAAPVEVMDREEIEKTGAQNVEDLIQHMTVASGSGYRGGGGGPGTAQINLRGLGAGATLVLLNGRRIVSSAAGITVPFVDISTIPLAVVERVEILKGGASAIYGSDAIAGVVNIITRKDWAGVMMQVDGRGTTASFDQREATASIALGASAGDLRMVGGLSYFRSNQLLAPKRDFTLDEGPAGGQGGNRSLAGQPGTFIAGGLMPDPECAAAAPGSRLDDSPLGQFCTFSFNDFRALTDNAERVAIYMHGEYDLTNHTKLFIEANVSKSRTDAMSSPSFPFTTRPTVPEDHIDNPFGMPAPFIGRPLGASAGGVINSSDDDTLRTALGLQGDFEGAAPNTIFESWEWELFTSFGVSRYQRFLPDTIFSDFLESINACSDSSDLSNCYNPFFSSETGTGTPNSESVLRGFTGALMTTVDQHLQTYNAGLSGGLFELPGGDLGFAVGAEYREEQRSSQIDHDTNEFDLSFYFGDDDAIATREVLAGYLELVWPIATGFELQTAARMENYSDAGSTFNPSAGLVLLPGEMAGAESQAARSLSLRANVSRAFRAPGLYQSFNGSTTVPASLDEGGPAAVFRPIRREGSPNLEPEKALAMSAGVTWAPAYELSLAADYWRYQYEDFITPENAQKILSDELAQIAIDPTFSDPRVERDEQGGLQRIVVPHVNIPGDIVTHGVDATVTGRYNGESAGVFTLGVETTYVLSYDIPRAQIAEITLMDGTLAGLPFCDTESCDVSGNLNEANIAAPSPALRLNVPISWGLEGHLVGAVLHFMSGLEDWSPSRFDEMTLTPRTIDSFMTVDAQYAYTMDEVVGRSTQLRIGVLNLLDQEPPFADVIDSFIAALHDPRGRMVYASIAQEF